MKQKDAWKITINALRLYFIQGNSQCPNINETIHEWIVETLDTIRNTKKPTAQMVQNARPSTSLEG